MPIMKNTYVKPAAEELQELLAANLLDPSVGGDLENYQEGSDFTW